MSGFPRLGLPLLTHEITALQLTANNQILRHGAPFFGDLGQPGEKLTVPLPGLYFPVKAPKNRGTRQTLHETIGGLISCVCAYTARVAGLRQMFALSLQPAEHLPGYLLHFQPEKDFWQILDES